MQAPLFQKKIGLIFLCLLFSISYFLFPPSVYASTNISATTTDHWAWNDSIGWMDFYNTLTVTVSSTALSGYASSSAGDISLDCATTRNGNICGRSQYQVLNDNSGNLAAWAWNDTYGWISFCGGQGTADCPGTTSYLTYINGSSGDFEGWAWNDTVGWFSFNCNNQPGGCTTSDYRVNTSWRTTSTIGTLDSSTFDTNVNAGAQLNSVMWRGNLPVGTSVKFQFATSNSSSGPWTFIGTDGTSNTYYAPSGQGVQLKLDYSLHNNYRYFRYRVSLFSNTSSTISPRVDDIIVNWSP